MEKAQQENKGNSKWIQGEIRKWGYQQIKI